MNLTLMIVTPTGVTGPMECDSIRLTLSDDLNGKMGGSYGIRAGHAKALISLQEGPIEALMEEKVLLKGKHGQGFATVENNTVKVVAEKFEED